MTTVVTSYQTKMNDENRVVAQKYNGYIIWYRMKHP